MKIYSKFVRPLRLIEGSFRVAGVACATLFVVSSWHQPAFAQRAIEQFYDERSPNTFYAAVADIITSADQRDWSESRIASYDRASIGAADSAIALLRIPRLSLEAPVFEGALEPELDRGPGRIRGTAEIGHRGNLGIAGHRDGFFRVLKDIEPGDEIEILDRASAVKYRVTETWIVTPDAVHVLDPTDENALTLVTCYPFYFVGSAPERFIVRATAVE